MAEIKIPSAEDINREITEAIARSAIGEELTEVINKKARELSNQYTDTGKTLGRVIDKEIERVAIGFLQAEPMATMLREKVEAVITEAMVEQFVGAIWARHFD
jgi:hypothetical protein